MPILGTPQQAPRRSSSINAVLVTRQRIIDALIGSCTVDGGQVHAIAVPINEVEAVVKEELAKEGCIKVVHEDTTYLAYIPSRTDLSTINAIHQVNAQVKELELANASAISGNATCKTVKDVQMTIKRHIDLLHRYNEIKDTVQAMMGKVAYTRGLMTADLYTDYGLEIDD